MQVKLLKALGLWSAAAERQARTGGKAAAKGHASSGGRVRKRRASAVAAASWGDSEAAEADVDPPKEPPKHVLRHWEKAAASSFAAPRDHRACAAAPVTPGDGPRPAVRRSTPSSDGEHPWSSPSTCI